MKLGILTFHRANNYGAVLQCYALQKFLSDRGNDVYVIDYINENLRQTYKNFHIDSLNVKKILSAVYNYDLKAARNRIFGSFREKYIRLSDERNITKSQLPELRDKYDCFVAGSDQVWNPLLTGWDESYFLSFASPEQRVSYAASLGNYHDNDETRDFFRKNIELFRSVSVREESSREYLVSLLGRRIYCNIDPVFLCPRGEWEKISGPEKISERYIFVYSLHEERAYAIAQELAEKENLTLVSIPNSKRINAGGIKKIDASVEEFLNYIRYADYVITDSFHATAFSIIFRKRFLVVLKSRWAGLNSRLENLLDFFGLSDRLNPEKIRDETNYTRVERLIEERKNEAVKYFSGLE